MNNKQLGRKQRLQSAPKCIQDYTGKDIVRGYRRHFHVDKLCALIELKMCGIDISNEKIEAARRDVEQLSIIKAEKKAQHCTPQKVHTGDSGSLKPQLNAFSGCQTGQSSEKLT